MIVLTLLQNIENLYQLTQKIDSLSGSFWKCFSFRRNRKVNFQHIKWMKDMEMKYIKSNKIIENVCKEFNEPIRTEIYRDFLMVDFDHKVASCLHAKVGSTTWSNYFYEILPSDIREKLQQKFGNRLFKQEIIRPYFRLHSEVMSNTTSDAISIRQVTKVLEKHKMLTFSFVHEIASYVYQTSSIDLHSIQN